MKKKQILLVLTIAVFSVGFAYLLKHHYFDFSREIAIDLRQLGDSGCTQHQTSEKVVIDATKCSAWTRTIQLRINPLFKGRYALLRAFVKSGLSRTAIHIGIGEKTYYMYHSGDQQSQFLTSDPMLITDDTISLSFIADEAGQKDIVEFGPAFFNIVDKLGNLLPAASYTSVWARTNNPNAETYYDRYSSQNRNFTIALHNLSSTLWERDYSLGVNDRFNSGDFFCFPDDKILFIGPNSETEWLYLGGLQWTRKVSQSAQNLHFTFTHSDTLASNLRMEQPHAIKTLKDNFPSSTRFFRKKISANLKKNYIFNVDSAKAVVSYTGSLSIPKGWKAFLIIEDAAFMDFIKGNFAGVHSYYKNIVDGGFVSYLNVAPKAFQYRIRENHPSIASFYTSENAVLRFVLPNFLPFFLEKNPDKVLNLKNRIPFFEEFATTNFRVFGLGFEISDNFNTQFEMNFMDGFNSPQEVMNATIK